MVKILAFSGSTREGSFNKKLLKIAVQGARNSGADVTELDLRDIPMPLYDGDLEEREGIPENGLKFAKLLDEHDGFLIASPEYNGSYSAVLKNAIDWASRPQDGKPELYCFKDKTAAIISVSGYYYAGIRGLIHLRALLSQIGVTVISSQINIPNGGTAFNEDGSLNKEKKQASTLKLGADLAEYIQKLRALKK